MKWSRILTLCSLVALSFACSSAASSSKTSRVPTKDLVQRSKPAIVRIEVVTATGPGVGTGFVISPDGRIATNLHVISGAREATVTLLDGTKVPLEEIAAIDAERDLAIIKIKTGKKLPTLRLGDSDEVAAGDAVIAIGNPLGVFDYSVSDGLISSVRALSESLTILQISAPISQGSSGGPLFNEKGEVIGVATAIIGEGQNINLGIPSNYLRPLMQRDERWSLSKLTEVLGEPRESAGDAPQGGKPRIQRRVPNHDLSVLKGCSDDAIRQTVQSIGDAIQNGAPLYNQGNHEACFRIYEGTAIRLEREVECQGLREALGQGLLRASTEQDYSLKAWAMRDTFDGILLVIQRSLQQP